MLSRAVQLPRNSLGYMLTCHLGKLPLEILEMIVDISPLALTLTCKTLRILSYNALFKTLNVSPSLSYLGISRFVPVTPKEISRQLVSLTQLLDDKHICMSVEKLRLNINDDSEVDGQLKAEVLSTSLMINNKLKRVTTLEMACDDLHHLEKLPALTTVTHLRMGFGAAQPTLIPGLASILKVNYPRVESLYINFSSLLDSTSVAYDRFALVWIEQFRNALYDQNFTCLTKLWVECEFCHLHTMEYKMDFDDRLFRDHIYWCRTYKD
ncbi:hypothetical protein E3P86_00764 [Wallemia ichthyophaga]|uniref:F-box domain-containing protein n=1 Tax=Wallemia ichthyophaga TaxID=245174 RepID=A0A4V4M698_WALIC|nr:hypothetical protein E3P86_00764 [Wallemia ichthyophaga]